MLFELELPSFDTLIWNSKVRFKRQVKNCCNGIISQLNLVLWSRLIRILPCCVFFPFLLLTVYICLCVCFLCNFVLFVFAMGRVAWNKPVMMIITTYNLHEIHSVGIYCVGCFFLVSVRLLPLRLPFKCSFFNFIYYNLKYGVTKVCNLLQVIDVISKSLLTQWFLK